MEEEILSCADALEEAKDKQLEMKELAGLVCDELENRIYQNIGSGIFSLIWKGAIMALLFVVSYASVQKFWH